MAMKIAEKVVQSVDAFFSSGATGSVTNHDARARTESGQAKRKATEAASIDFVQAAMKAGLGAMAEVTQEHLALMESRTSALETRASRIEGTLVEADSALKGVKEDVQTSADRMETLEKEMGDLRLQLASPPTGAQPPPPASQVGASPETRCRLWATMGSLGWDCDAHTLLSRAKEVLQLASVPPESYTCLAAKKTPGSAVGLRFNSVAELEDANAKVYSLRKSFLESGSCVWLNFSKSREEMAPARIFHKASDLLQQMLAEKLPGEKVEKVPAGKIIKVKGAMVAFVSNGQLRFTSSSKEHFTQNQLDEVKAFAES